ncbi:uncharacterized protein LOC112684230 [Sipha flava]|uniref:Uncharacterized protein LOC112684230 n=1 Tax=Sipha flava TaxID=143950 RepID=A0A8B8FL89_9HEMI|nr:uncharacterized protein LOC112684230 [Sipha flava]
MLCLSLLQPDKQKQKLKQNKNFCFHQTGYILYEFGFCIRSFSTDTTRSFLLNRLEFQSTSKPFDVTASERDMKNKTPAVAKHVGLQYVCEKFQFCFIQHEFLFCSFSGKTA